MVAKLTTAERFKPLPEPSHGDRWHLYRITRDEALAMVRMGIIPEDASTELLDGVILHKDRAARGQDPMTIGFEHRACVETLSALRKKIDNSNRHVESQQPLVCSETHVPEPDFMVLRGASIADYDDDPTATDAYCVIEVADASYERDAGLKLVGYARAGVQQYIIINVRNRTAEVYTNPDSTAGSYQSQQVISDQTTLPIRVGADEFFPVPLRDVLP